MQLENIDEHDRITVQGESYTKRSTGEDVEYLDVMVDDHYVATIKAKDDVEVHVYDPADPRDSHEEFEFEWEEDDD